MSQTTYSLIGCFVIGIGTAICGIKAYDLQTKKFSSLNTIIVSGLTVLWNLAYCLF